MRLVRWYSGERYHRAVSLPAAGTLQSVSDAAPRWSALRTRYLLCPPQYLEYPREYAGAAFRLLSASHGARGRTALARAGRDWWRARDDLRPPQHRARDDYAAGP